MGYTGYGVASYGRYAGCNASTGTNVAATDEVVTGENMTAVVTVPAKVGT